MYVLREEDIRRIKELEDQVETMLYLFEKIKEESMCSIVADERITEIIYKCKKT